MSATLAIRNVPDLPDVREVVIDCKHATTTMWAINPDRVGLTDHDAVLMTLEQHATERPDCNCIAGLWRRYGRETPCPS